MLTYRLTSDDDESACCFHCARTSRVDGATTQWLSFRVRSNGLFRHSPGSHFAIVARARLGFDPKGRPSSISGRGLSLGDTSAASGAHCRGFAHHAAFGGARGVQVESFWPGGNFLWRETGRLDDGLRDGVDYHVQLHVSDERWIAYRIEGVVDGATVAAAAAQIRDAAEHPVAADATGIVIALGRGRGETGPWQVEFSAIEYGWF